MDTERLFRRILALREPRMRAVAVREFLEETPSDKAAGILLALESPEASRTQGSRLLLEALSTLLANNELPYEVHQELYRALKDRGPSTLSGMFFSRPLLTPEDGETASTVIQSGTLGHRKTQARLHDRDTLMKLLAHPEPEVIPILLENPLIKETDVVRLAVRRPANGDILGAIAASRRWGHTYAVKRALVLNPTSPLDLSLRLVGFFHKQDLKLIESSPALPAALRQAARTAIKRASQAGKRKE